MLNNQSAVAIPVAEVTENSIRIEETGLQMEELEPRVAPNTVWGD